MSSSSNTRVYVGRMNRDVRERDLEKFFRDYGKINDINMKNGYAFVNFDDHRDADDAVYELDGKELLGDKVLVEFTRGSSSRDRRGDRSRDYGRSDRGGYDRGGNDRGGNDRGGYDRGGYDRGGYGSGGRFKNSLFERPFNTKYRCLVQGISSSTDWRDLKDFFRRVAEVTFADAHRIKSGEGVADFKCKEDLKRAIRELDDCKLNGRRVKLTEDTKLRSTSRSRSRSRSRSTSRSPRRRSRSPLRRSARSRSKDRRSRSADYKESDNFEATKSRSKSRTPEDVTMSEDDKK